MQYFFFIYNKHTLKRNLCETENVEVSWDSLISNSTVCVFRGIGRGRGVPLPRQMVAGCRPGFDQLLFCHNDNANGEDTEEDMGYFSSYVPGAYDETNRY